MACVLLIINAFPYHAIRNVSEQSVCSYIYVYTNILNPQSTFERYPNIQRSKYLPVLRQRFHLDRGLGGKVKKWIKKIFGRKIILIDILLSKSNYSVTTA